MPRSDWTPSIGPSGYLVVADFGRDDRFFGEADVEQTDLETVITDLMSDQFRDPIRVIAFNGADHRSEDVSGTVAREIRRRADFSHQDLSSSIEAFVESYIGRERQPR